MENSDLSPSQIKLLELIPLLKDLVAICYIVKLEEEINSLWENGDLNQEKIESFRHLHERTPYNK